MGASCIAAKSRHALGTGWTLRQTQGSAIFEIYRVIARPFQLSSTSQAERLSDAKTLELQARLVELESQNQKLQELLDYVEPQAIQTPHVLGKAIVAPVIGRSDDLWLQQIKLCRGSKA